MADETTETTQETTETTQQETAQAIDYDKLAGIIDGRIKATEDSVLKGYLKEQGLTGDEMAEAIKAYKDSRTAKEPDTQGMQAQIDELRAAMEVANTSARLAQVENAVILEATKMGIDAKAIPYLARMADLSDVGDKAGKIDGDKVAKALGKVLDDVPALKPNTAQAQGFRIGGTGDKDASAPKIERDKVAAIFGVKNNK